MFNNSLFVLKKGLIYKGKLLEFHSGIALKKTILELYKIFTLHVYFYQNNLWASSLSLIFIYFYWLMTFKENFQNMSTFLDRIEDTSAVMEKICQAALH